MEENLLERLVVALESATKEKGNGMAYKAAPNTADHNTAQLLYQPGGMFTTPGMENEVISLHIAPEGLGAALPAYPATIDDPRYGFITGFSDDIGAEAINPCDNAPTGYMKTGSLTAQFGRLMRQTDTVEIDKLLHTQRGANTDLRLLNSVLGGNVGLDINGMDQTDLLNMVVKAQMVGVGVRFERLLAKLMWSGAIANNTAGGGYMEFPGLDSQIATGQVDAGTNIAMPSADSLIYNFGYSDVDGTAKDIVEYLSMMEFYLREVARKTNMLPITFALVMRPELWFELSAVWPCRYLTHRCGIADNSSPMVINDNVNVQLRDAMRNGRYIDINGNRYPVIVDDGIVEQTNITSASVPAGNYASSIYFVPLKVRGNFPVLYWEYINYTGVNRQLSPMGAGAANASFWTDGGKYLWVYRDAGFCFDLQAKIEPRVVLRTPHLAGKIQNVRYSPLTHLRSFDPDSAYWRNGGVSLPSTPTEGYAVWR